MPILKEPERITLVEGLSLLQNSGLSPEEAKTRLRPAFERKAFLQSPCYAFEYEGADIDWTTGSVKIPRKKDRFTPSFRRSDFDRYFFEDRMAPSDEIKQNEGAHLRKVFVVHGHDEAALQTVARFLEHLNLETIVLREQPDQGRTIIEKFQDCASEVGFAVVLLTPDDLGGSVVATTSQTARARQNVIFELGYFVGKLGRGRAYLLRKGDIEIPSDLYGVIYSDMDAADGWQVKLLRELKAARFDVDANRIWK
jgi:predicted nucleotide-binding protein